MQPGIVDRIDPALRRIVAPNPSPLTAEGTNSWLLGRGEVKVIDPGPEDESHLAALLAATGGERIATIVVTHAHRDHAGLARRLSQATGAPVHGFGPVAAGMSPLMRALAAQGVTGGEGLQPDFVPDLLLGDGESLMVQGRPLQAIHTPGHLSDHLCLSWGEALFSGDHVMGWSSSIVSPPEGDMGAYMASLDRIARGSWRVFHPGHGPSIPDPRARVADLTRHRRTREAAILAALAAGPAGLSDLVARVYTDTPAALHAAAGRNVFAHLVDLSERTLIRAHPALAPDAVFALR